MGLVSPVDMVLWLKVASVIVTGQQSVFSILHANVADRCEETMTHTHFSTCRCDYITAQSKVRKPAEMLEINRFNVVNTSGSLHFLFKLNLSVEVRMNDADMMFLSVTCDLI